VRKVSTRVVAATNRDLHAAVEAGSFRADLYYRLNVVAVDLPPLRERTDDIPALVHHFMQRYAARHRKNVTRVAPEALEALQAYSWPGNIRELENLIQRAIVLATSEEIGARDLPVSVRPRPAARARRNPAWDRPFAEVKDMVVANFERQYVESIMARTHGNLAESARLAGMDRANFRRLARRNSIDLDRLRLD